MGKLAHGWLMALGWTLLIISWTCLELGSVAAFLVSGVAFQLFLIVGRDIYLSRKAARR